MGLRKKEVEEVKVEEVVVPHVVEHLDVDPNDPRLRPAGKALPSLNDEDQQ